MIANTADLGLIDYDTTGIATVPNDAVALGQVASYDVVLRKRLPTRLRLPTHQHQSSSN